MRALSARAEGVAFCAPVLAGVVVPAGRAGMPAGGGGDFGVAGADDNGLNKSGSSSRGMVLPVEAGAEPVMAGGVTALDGFGAGRTIGSGGVAPAPAPDPAVGAAGGVGLAADLEAVDFEAAGLGAALVVEARLLVLGLAGVDDAASSAPSVCSSVRLGLRGVAGGSIAIFLHRPDKSSGLIVSASDSKS
jgi:hypothetical protein